jgi:uncharacterized protein YjbI with pentapeptide repeats
MVNEEHLAILWQGVDVWDAWREANPEVRPDIIGAKLVQLNLSRVDLSDADLSRAELNEADLTEANLTEAGLIEAKR